LRCDCAYSLDNVQSNDALEGEQLEQDPMLRQSCLVLSIEFQCADNGNGSDDDFDNGEPDVREVDAVGGFAVCSDCERDDGCDPDDESGWDELQNTIPEAL
jgi:hypothetical protein